MAAKSENPGPKTFDVTRPEETKAAIGSKPMIVGHKTLTRDPMMTDAKKDSDSDESENKNISSEGESDVSTNSDEQIEPKQAPSKAKKVISPISHDKEINDATTETDSDKEPISVGEQETLSQETTDQKLVDPEVKKMDRKQALEELVGSKKYFVTIHRESSGLTVKSVLAAIILPTVLLVVVYVALVDAEIIESSIILPFDLL